MDKYGQDMHEVTVVRPEEESHYLSPPVQRACRLLRYIAEGGSFANIRAVATQLDISRTTLLRLLHTFEAERFIEKVSGGGDYQIGIDLVGMVGDHAYGQDLVRIGMPVIARLAEETGLSAHLGVLDGLDAMYLARRVPNVPLASNITVGSRISAHATTLGRAILAVMDAETVRAMYAGCVLGQYTDMTPTTWESLEARLRAEREMGYSVSDGVYSNGVSSVAAPIFGHGHKVLAALNVTGPTSLFKMSLRRETQIIEQVCKAAHTLSVRIGDREEAAPPVGSHCDLHVGR